MTSITNLQRGMHVLDSTNHSSVYNSPVNNSCNLWHLTLGYISSIGLQIISRLFPFIHCKNNDVLGDSFHFGNTKKIEISNNITHSYAPFDILHADF